MTKVTFATVSVFEYGYLNLKDHVEKLNRKALKHGMEPITMAVREVAFVRIYKGGFGCSEPLYHIEINGIEPCIDGWRLVARVEFNDTIGQVVRLAPNVCDDGSFASYREHNGHCDHCNSIRRRNDVFILEDCNGNRKSVGRNCLADFIRDGDANSIIRYAEFADDLGKCGDKDYEGDGVCMPNPKLQPFLTIVAMLTRRLGWVSRTTSKDNDVSSTADCAARYLYSREPYRTRWIDANELFVSDNDVKLAGDAIEWVCNVEDRSEYINTIKRIGQAGIVDMKSLAGYAASIISAYKKTLDVSKARAAFAKNTDFIGNVKQRLKNLEVRVLRVRYIDGYYGTTTIVAMETDIDGGVAPLVWFASGSQDIAEGTILTIDATVKDQKDDPKFGKQTIVTRCSIK